MVHPAFPVETIVSTVEFHYACRHGGEGELLLVMSSPHRGRATKIRITGREPWSGQAGSVLKLQIHDIDGLIKQEREHSDVHRLTLHVEACEGHGVIHHHWRGPMHKADEKDEACESPPPHGVKRRGSDEGEYKGRGGFSPPFLLSTTVLLSSPSIMSPEGEPG